jgi:phosphoglycerate dehydrogenase-like enzyme
VISLTSGVAEMALGMCLMLDRRAFAYDQGSGVWDGFIARYYAIHCGLLHDYILY